MGEKGSDLPRPGRETGLGGLASPLRREPLEASEDVVTRLAAALGVEPAYFREHRLVVISNRLEEMPEMVDRLKRLAV